MISFLHHNVKAMNTIISILFSIISTGYFKHVVPSQWEPNTLTLTQEFNP